MKKTLLSLAAAAFATAAVFTAFRGADAQAPAAAAPPLQEYVLVSRFNDANALSRDVTEKLREGWRLHGSHFAVQQNDGAVVYTQALVR